MCGRLDMKHAEIELKRSSLELKQSYYDINCGALELCRGETRLRFGGNGVPQGCKPSGAGILPQNLESIVPHAVRDVQAPTQCDDEGNLTVKSATMKAVNYNRLIPLLIVGFKEQAQVESVNMGMLQELQSRLADLENSVATIAVNSSVQADEMANKLSI